MYLRLFYLTSSKKNTGEKKRVLDNGHFSSCYHKALQLKDLQFLVMYLSIRKELCPHDKEFQGETSPPRKNLFFWFNVFVYLLFWSLACWFSLVFAICVCFGEKCLCSWTPPGKLSSDTKYFATEPCLTEGAASVSLAVIICEMEVVDGKSRC